VSQLTAKNGSSFVDAHRRRNAGGMIRFLFAEGVKPVEIIRRMQAQYVDNCLSHSKIYEWIHHFKKGGLLYAMRRDQEGCQHQGLRTDDGAPAIQSRFRPGRFPCIWLSEKFLRGRRFSSDEEVICAMQNWLKMQPEPFFLTGFKSL
jgi:hypothetical protein